jgi:hypothetical protein
MEVPGVGSKMEYVRMSPQLRSGRNEGGGSRRTITAGLGPGQTSHSSHSNEVRSSTFLHEPG